ncbi:hypothetical protein LINPERPRIM_LOCUS6084 [Linum perenne]
MGRVDATRKSVSSFTEETLPKKLSHSFCINILSVSCIFSRVDSMNVLGIIGMEELLSHFWFISHLLETQTTTLHSSASNVNLVQYSE